MAAFFMKNIRSCSRLLVPIIFALALSLSCDRRVNEQLDSIEDSLSTDPADAYEKLTSISTKQLRSKSTQARYALLMSLAMDKNYIDTDCDSLIRVAVHYYDRYGGRKERMLSMYMLGRVQRNAGNKAGAIVSLLKAKEQAEDILDFHYIGLSARNIAELYGSCNDEDSELFYYQESVRAFDEEKAPLYAAYSRLGEAQVYMAKGLSQKADSLLTILEKYSRKSDGSLLYYVLRDRAINNRYSNNPDSRLIISLQKEVDNLGRNKRETSDYGTLAWAYEKLGDRDSVCHYLSLAEKMAHTLLDSIHLCNTRAVIYDHRGDHQSANEQYKKGVELHNRMVFNRENQLLSNAISDYNRQEASRQSDIAGYRLRLLILSILAMISLVIILIQVVVIRRRQIREKNRIIQERESRIEENMAQIQEIAEELRVSKTGQSEMSQRINSLIQDKIAIVKMCADAYEAVKNEKKTKDPYHYLDEDPLQRKTEQMQQFLSALDKFRNDDSLFSLLEDNVNALHSNIMANLRVVCSKDVMEKPQFDEDDFRMLMLFYAGIPDRTIAFLMDMSFASVRTRKTRYKERLLRSDIKDGPFFVQELGSSR